VLDGTDQDSSFELRPQSNSCPGLGPGLYRQQGCGRGERVGRSSAGITQANGPDNAAKPSRGPSLVILCRSFAMAEVGRGIPPLGTSRRLSWNGGGVMRCGTTERRAGQDHSFSCMHLQLQFPVAGERAVRCGRGIDSGTEERRVQRKGVTWLKENKKNKLMGFSYIFRYRICVHLKFKKKWWWRGRR